MKKTFLCAAALLAVGAALSAQQLTYFAVVDLNRVYTRFFRDSKEVRDLETESKRVQGEIDRMNKEIQQLRTNQVNTELQGDKAGALRIEQQIVEKAEFLRRYHETKTRDIEAKRARLAQGNAFSKQVQEEIGRIAESEGYSLVFDIQKAEGVLWYSPAIDITDKLIQNLLSRGRK
ncbi:MAG: OmpH family outer membrane protein [Treponema sp.]|jgi:outer membrane protein|nr:OmpH family outer membrane protein [Treponema sp.]